MAKLKYGGLWKEISVLEREREFRERHASRAKTELPKRFTKEWSVNARILGWVTRVREIDP